MSSSKKEVVKASYCSGFKDVALLLTARVHDSKIALAEEIVQASKREGKRVKKLLANKG